MKYLWWFYLSQLDALYQSVGKYRALNHPYLSSHQPDFIADDQYIFCYIRMSRKIVFLTFGEIQFFYSSAYNIKLFTINFLPSAHFILNYRVQP